MIMEVEGPRLTFEDTVLKILENPGHDEEDIDSERSGRGPAHLSQTSIFIKLLIKNMVLSFTTDKQ